MILAIDYDDTYSAFPKEFDALRKMFQKSGHKVYIVTARDKKTEKIQDDLGKFDKVFYTAGKAKAAAVRADIWIDDNPVTLCCDFVAGEPHAKPNEPLHQGYKGKHILWNWEEDRFCSYTKKSFKPKHEKN
jgi:hypothetical protein